MRKLMLSLLLLLFCVSSASALPAYPGARGFGTDTTAGSGRHLSPPNSTVYRVTSLADAGPGSLRECAAAAAPRVCIFETSGTIHLTSGQLDILNPYITIAGQTAPAPGILVRGCGIRIKTHNVLIQHIEVRPGDELLPSSGSCHPGVREAIGIVAEATDAYGLVFDHLSLAWGLDENIGIGYNAKGRPRDMTFSNNIISQGLFESVHPDGPHSMGVLMNDGTRNATFFGNVIAHNKDRNIRTKGNTTVEFVNNYIHNWGGISDWNVYNTDDAAAIPPLFHNIIGNVYTRGPDTPPVGPGVTGTVIYVQKGRINPLSRFFVADLKCPAGRDDGCFNALIPVANRASVPALPGSSVVPMPSADVWNHVSANAGARPGQRNPQDLVLLQGVASGGGGIIDCVTATHPKTGAPCPKNAGGWPERIVNRRPLPTPENPNAVQPSGYTRLEEWLHGFLSEVEGSGGPVTPTPSAVPTATPVSPPPLPTAPATVVPTAAPTSSPVASATPGPTPGPSPVPQRYTGTFTGTFTGTLEMTPVK